MIQMFVRIHKGNPIEYSEREMRNVEMGEISVKGQVKQGKKWKDASFSVNRIGKAEYSIHQGVIEGSVWCSLEDKEKYRKELFEGVKGVIRSIIDGWKVTLESLN